MGREAALGGGKGVSIWVLSPPAPTEAERGGRVLLPLCTLSLVLYSEEAAV